METLRTLQGQLIISFLLFGSFRGFAQEHGDHYHNGRYHVEDWPDSLPVITVSGRVNLDDSHFHPLYFMDEGLDGVSDYLLGFGPYWYEPASGADRPGDGDEITVKGGFVEDYSPPLLVVFELNGLAWRDSTGAPPWSGTWVHRNASDTTFIYCPTDSLDWMGYPQQSMRGGMMSPDSIYCQFEEIPIDSMPGLHDDSMVEGYYVDIFLEHGHHMRGSDMMMQFDRGINIRFHYDEDEVHRGGFSEESIHVRYLDDAMNWQMLEGAELDLAGNSVVINDAEVRTYYVLSASAITSVESSSLISIPDELTLLPNFPNPFNPRTTIRFNLTKVTDIRLTVYDIQGRMVKQLYQGLQNAGEHTAFWDGKDSHGQTVSSGVYVIELSAGLLSKTRQMTLLR